MDIAELEERLVASIARRYRSHAAKDLNDYIFSNYLFHSLDRSFIDFAYEHRHEIRSYLSSPDRVAALTSYCIHATKRYTYQRNQFINFTQSYDALLRAEYADFFTRIRGLLQEADSTEALERSFEVLLSLHHARLRLILASYCVSYHDRELEQNPLLRTVPCEEYSARFQLRLLSVDLDRIQEPILDIGCGATGELVRFLRNEGCVAFGLDRLAPSGPHFFEADWFDFDYAAQPWGTVVAHHSLSTHLIYNYLHSSSYVDQYARLYTKILSSLKPGGAFHYAPGVPFLEDRIANAGSHSVARTAISTNRVLGIGEIAYAVTVTRDA